MSELPVNNRSIIKKIYDIALKKNQESDLHSVISDLRISLSGVKIAFIIIFLYAIGILISYSCINQILAPVENSANTEKVIKIDTGMSISSIGSLLESENLIKSSLIFQLVSILTGKSHSLKAGAYSIRANMSITDIIKKINSGETIVYKLTIPEGLTIAEIASIWERDGFGKSTDFIDLTTDVSMLNKYNIEADSLEGYLFPDTYIFPYGISEREAIEKMLEHFNKQISNALNGKSIDSQKLHEIISLASIIEKEAKVSEERPIISAVYHNRLKIGMKLESCPTVLYGLGYPNRELTYDDLRNASLRYNTYVYNGLPPGPICNPGLKSIIAAIKPADVQYLYFVSKNDGTHHFSENYNDFLSAKRKYQSQSSKRS
jgi:UPF0755 protein